MRQGWLRCCLFLVLVTIVVLGQDSYIGGFAKFKCFKQKPMTGCNTADQNMSIEDVGIYLFTGSSKEQPEFLHLCGGKLPNNTSFDRNKKTRVIIPGYLGYVCTTAYPTQIKDQFLCRNDSNVIIYDFMYKLGERLDYYFAVQQVVNLGEKIAFVMENIMNQTGVSPDSFHIIGHSLGAHIAGIAGQALKNKGKEIDRITGLEPAGPGFQNASRSMRLDWTDAKWVDTIHSTYDKCLPALGDPRPVGHSDFYINLDSAQSRCAPQEAFEHFVILDPLVGLAYNSPPLCIHIRVVYFYLTSINPCWCQYIGLESNSYEDCKTGICGSCGANGSKCEVMGHDWDRFPRQRGNKIYCVKIKDVCPYCYNNTCVDTTGFPSISSVNSSSLCCDSGKQVKKDSTFM